jgi:hypothetical protein
MRNSTVLTVMIWFQKMCTSLVCDGWYPTDLLFWMLVMCAFSFFGKIRSDEDERVQMIVYYYFIDSLNRFWWQYVIVVLLFVLRCRRRENDGTSGHVRDESPAFAGLNSQSQQTATVGPSRAEDEEEFFRLLVAADKAATTMNRA